MSDRQKVQSLSALLSNTLFQAVSAAFEQPGVAFLENRHKNNITLHPSLRMAIGPPQPAWMLGDGYFGIYELPNTPVTAQLYALQQNIATNTSLTPLVELRRLQDPNEPDNIRVTVEQIWEFEPL
jgi:hypothetical protein